MHLGKDRGGLGIKNDTDSLDTLPTLLEGVNLLSVKKNGKKWSCGTFIQNRRGQPLFKVGMPKQKKALLFLIIGIKKN